MDKSKRADLNAGGGDAAGSRAPGGIAESGGGGLGDPASPDPSGAAAAGLVLDHREQLGPQRPCLACGVGTLNRAGAGEKLFPLCPPHATESKVRELLAQ